MDSGATYLLSILQVILFERVCGTEWIGFGDLLTTSVGKRCATCTVVQAMKVLTKDSHFFCSKKIKF